MKDLHSFQMFRYEAVENMDIVNEILEVLDSHNLSYAEKETALHDTNEMLFCNLINKK